MSSKPASVTVIQRSPVHHGQARHEVAGVVPLAIGGETNEIAVVLRRLPDPVARLPVTTELEMVHREITRIRRPGNPHIDRQLVPRRDINVVAGCEGSPSRAP